MTAKRKTPARAKAPAARSAISVLVAAANDATLPARAPAPAPMPTPIHAEPAPLLTAKREPEESAALRLAPRPPISGEERHRMIAKVAYGYAERARFGSDPVSDWLAAEREIDAMLARVAC